MYTALGAVAVLAGSFASGLVKPKEVQAVYEKVQPIIAKKLNPKKPVNKKLLETTVIPNSKSVSKEKPVLTVKFIKPTFDVLRVEKNGSILVAGRSGSEQTVELEMVNGTILGSTVAGTGGDFVILPAKPLAPGDYVLRLKTSDKSGKTVISDETSIIHVPKKGGEVLAMISRAGKATQITVKPKSMVKKEDTVAVNDPARKSAPAIKDKPKKAVAPRIILEAVEVEGGEIFVAGEVPRRKLVRIYIDNQFIGSAFGTSNNRFLLTKKYSLKAGEHIVRADVVERKTGSVLSRVEVPLRHELPKLALATAKPAKKAEPRNKQKKSVEGEQDMASREVPALTPKKAHKDDNVRAPALALTKEPKPIRTGTTVIIKPGDNLWLISRRTYGKGIRYTTIYNANRDQIRDPSRIFVGQVFKIPEKMD
ncbi:MAG: LysM peptidoglycan-binding domain-containing protein [Rhizobiaceae bacterium]